MMSNSNSRGRSDLIYKHRKALNCKFRGILEGGGGPLSCNLNGVDNVLIDTLKNIRSLWRA